MYINYIIYPSYATISLLKLEFWHERIYIGCFGEYRIIKIEFLNDKTLVHYECSGLVSLMEPYNLRIISTEDKETSFRFSPENVKEIEEGSKKFVAELRPMDRSKEYTLQAMDFEKMYEFREDSKFAVEVPKDN